jgi:hypothetical protein
MLSYYSTISTDPGQIQGSYYDYSTDPMYTVEDTNQTQFI